MKKTVTYKEPKNYFNADMLKVAKDFDKAKAAKAKEASKTSTKKK